MSDRQQREKRLDEINTELARLGALTEPLRAERREIEQQNAREEWPEGPFTLHYWVHGSAESEEFDRPDDALRSADGIEDLGTGSTERITDRNGELVYDLVGYPPKRSNDRYPDPGVVLR